ncbi:Abhydrolase_6 domain-containing protein [Cephalotus follicularis]|uniref:Abhydrolase_6 domain-containing protein n=1 Tax=Cephalotus follicularis TaxID=3775 RepID=A0A1Q3CRG1_CEPFO|nr:Abhydrolase_6 domain-containing protein [Cephalotus follicularis]
MDLGPLLQIFNFYLSKTMLILQSMPSNLPTLLIQAFLGFFDTILSIYFRLCNMSPITIDLDNQTSTTMHFWTTNHRQFNKPNLVLIHGYGGHASWQFSHQLWSLSQYFNLYIPELLFFGKSCTNRTDRSDVFQAKCVMEGLKKLGVNRFNVFGISYGGFVTYRMAEIYGEEIQKVMIVSCAICYSDDQKEEQLRKIGRNPLDLLLPETPTDLRCMINMCIHKFDPFKWVPDFILRALIKVIK